MIVKKIINDVFPSIWPLVIFVLVVVVTLRCAYLFKGSKKLVFHKEVLSLVFIVYILCLYHILTYQDIGASGVNLIPFKEMFRYSFGSYKFFKNVIGNILLFIPFGFFASHYLNARNCKRVMVVTFIVVVSVEIMQYYIGRVFDIDDIILNIFGGFLGYLIYLLLYKIRGKLPKFMRSDTFLNILVIILIIVIILVSFKIDIFSYF